jgi:hypothetical protein
MKPRTSATDPLQIASLDTARGGQHMQPQRLHLDV